jgi:hypothetical protein
VPDADQRPRAALPGRRRISRTAIFLVITAICALVAAGFVIVPLVTDEPAGDGIASITGPLAAPSARTTPYIAFEDVSGDGRGPHLGLAALANRKAPLTVTPLRCQRIDIAGGHGLCLLTQGATLRTSFKVQIFDADFTVQHTLSLGGLLSRARVSPDGRHGAVTAFLSGHSYATNGEFSTTTTLLDLTTGRTLFNLEKLAITRDGKSFRAIDFNYWGVTFANDGRHFYATLASGHKTYLVEADLQTRTGRIIRENVECPALSPDNTRIAFKKRVDSGNGPWRFTVLDLKTMRETPLAESRSVDDQAAWLDDDHVLYGYENAVWVVRADGSDRPRLYLEGALSPSVVRPAHSPQPAST